MKTIFTILLLLFFMKSSAQDKIYVHTATAANIIGNYTIIDHPDLNGHPNAPIVYVNRWQAGGAGVYNNKVTGLWYNTTRNKWTIYNEDLSAFTEGASFNIYIASDPTDVFVHEATASNIYSHVTFLDHPELNGNNPGPFLAFSHYYNPNAVYNTGNYGQYYGGSNRKLFDEGFNFVPEGAAFKVLINGGTGAIQYSHASSASNISANWTTIDHPLLNGDPDATFVMSHYWGLSGSTTYLDAVLGVWYDGAQWGIYTEDTSINFPENVTFDIIIAPRDILGINENSAAASKIAVHPNPALTEVIFSADQIIETVDIYSILGQEVLSSRGNENSLQIDVSSLASGMYVAKVRSGEGIQTLKFLKE